VRAPLASAVLLLVAVIACAPLLEYGAANGHNITYDLVWSRNFSAQLVHGDLYPRWLPDMNQGAGSPAFYFYAPLPFYIATLVYVFAPAANPLTQLGWADWLLVAASGLAFFRYARQHFEPNIALFAAIIYMSLPYHFEIDLWRRQDLGELTNYIWMPLVLRHTERLYEHRAAFPALAVSYALMLLSHLPSALLFSLCLTPYVLALAPLQQQAHRLPRFVGAILVGVMLAAIYWVPALFTERYVHISVLWGRLFDFHTWLIPFNVPFALDSTASIFITRLLIALGASSLTFALCWFLSGRWRQPEDRRRAIACLLAFTTAWFLMSSWSLFVWEHVPLLSKVQFPWRAGSVVDLMAAISAAGAAKSLLQRRDFLAGGAAVTSAVIPLFCLFTANLQSLLDPFTDEGSIATRDDFVSRGLDAAEYQTIWNQSPEYRKSNGEASGRLNLTQGVDDARALPTHWRDGAIELSTHLEHPSSVIVHQFYYPGWQAIMDGGTFLALMPSARDGFIGMVVPAGDHRVEIKRVLLPAERVGTGMSALTLLILLVGWRSKVVTSQLWTTLRP
jgi:hypothetical protein